MRITAITATGILAIGVSLLVFQAYIYFRKGHQSFMQMPVVYPITRNMTARAPYSFMDQYIYKNNFFARDVSTLSLFTRRNYSSSSKTVQNSSSITAIKKRGDIEHGTIISEMVNETMQTVSSDQIDISGSKRILKKCPHDFKVFVYPLQLSLPSLRISEEARTNKTLHVCQKCILEQFALEYIFYDFFTQFCGRTTNPDEADFFYLPVIRDAEYRVALNSRNPKKRAPSATEDAILRVLEKGDFSRWQEVFNLTSKYWKAHDGSDHIIIMPAPVTNLRHESGYRGFFHYMMHLHPPIFVGLEYSLGFVNEYPICATKKNIMVPYPTTDPDLFNGKLFQGNVKRSALIYYTGGVHGECVAVRKALKEIMHNSSKMDAGIVPVFGRGLREREHGYRAATFCPVPIGDSPSSKRMYDAMNFGCIPVVISDELVWAYSDQTAGSLQHKKFSLQSPQSVVRFTAESLLSMYEGKREQLGVLPSGVLFYDLLKSSRGEVYDSNGIYINPLVQILSRVSTNDIEILRAGVAQAAPMFQYYDKHPEMHTIPTASHIFPDGKAMQVFSELLSMRKVYGIDNIRRECAAERTRPGHKYIGNFPCNRRRLRGDTTPSSSESTSCYDSSSAI